MDNLPGTPIPQVPDELFISKRSDSVYEQTKVRKKLVKIVERVEYPESGGVFVYHRSFPYPEKGTRDDIMMMSIQFVKRVMINWVRFFSYKWTLVSFFPFVFLPWKIKIKVIEKFIDSWFNYAGFVNETGKHYVLEKRYYTLSGRELMKGIEVFLKELGFSNSDECSHYFIALIDNDTAYYYRRVDITNDADKEQMLRNPAKELKRLFLLFAERESRPHMIKKFESFFLPITLALYHPRVRRAFKKAVQSMDFENLRYDDADRYHVRTFGDYNFFGMTYAERIQKWPLEQHTLAEILWRE